MTKAMPLDNAQKRAIDALQTAIFALRRGKIEWTKEQIERATLEIEGMREEDYA